MTSWTKGRLRDWGQGSASYGPTGRAAKSSMPPRQSYGADGVVKGWSVSAQINEATGRAEGGAPNISGMDRSGSGDGGRMKYNREGSGETPPGGRHDDEAPRSK